MLGVESGWGLGCSTNGAAAGLWPGVVGVGPGMAQSFGLHSGIPSGSPVKMTLLSHCEISLS